MMCLTSNGSTAIDALLCRWGIVGAHAVAQATLLAAQQGALRE